MGQNIRVGVSARGMALRVIVVFLGGTLIGSLAPESGNVLGYYLQFPYEEGHFFNPLFLVIGILGIGLACIVGYKKRG